MRFLPLLVLPLAAGTYAPRLDEQVDVRRIAFDRQGFVWVSGERGTFRFDGSRFLSAGRLGLPMEGSSHVAVTNDGTVWAKAANALWRLEAGRFRQVSTTTIMPPIEAAGDLLYTSPGPLRVWYRDGAEWRWADGPTVPHNLRLHGETDGRVWLGGRFTPGKPSAVSWLRLRNGAFESGEEFLDRQILPQKEVTPAGPDTIFTAHTTGVFRFVRKGAGPFRLASEYTSSLPASSRLLAGDRREVWYEACGQWLSSQGRKARMPGATGVALDLAGDLWGALGGKGLLFYGDDSTVRSYSLSGLPDRPVTGVSRLGGRLYVARQDVTGVIDDTATESFCDGTRAAWPGLEAWGGKGEDAPFTGILAGPDGTVWVLGKNQGVMRIGPDGSAVVPGNPGAKIFVQGMRQMVFSEDGRLWVASKVNLVEVLRQPTLAYSQTYRETRYVSGFTRDRRSQLFAIADGGMPKYDQGNWRETPLPPCLLSQKLRTVAIASDAERWFGYRDRPGFTKAVASGSTWSCRHFEESNGFGGDTQFLAVDRKGRVWRGSSAGVFVRRTDGDWARILAPDGEMHQLFHEEPDGAILVGMGDRLLRVPPRLAEDDPGVAPQVSYWETDGQIMLQPAALSARLGADATLFFSALPERHMAAPPPIEYRFDSGKWTALRGHAFPMDEAPRTAGRMEFRYAGSANLIALPVSISAPWWRTYWFGGVLAGALSLLALPFLRLIRRWRYHTNKRRFLARSRLRSEPPAGEGELREGALLQGRYRVDGLLAEGGFSQVFEATDVTTGARVVVKRLRTGDMPPDRMRRRLAQEVAAVSMVQHPGIVPIIETWVDDAFVPHMVLPRVEGPTLREQLRARPFQRGEAMELLRQLGEILAAAHARGVVHSDLKPENILLSTDGPRIIDFGTSNLHLSTGLSSYSRPAGSVHYMAPEQLLGRYSKATDVYAFALVAFEILTGRRYVDVALPMSDQWEEEFRRVAVEELGLTTLMAAVFVDALRFDPERRAQDVGAWVDDLRRSA